MNTHIFERLIKPALLHQGQYRRNIRAHTKIKWVITLCSGGRNDDC